MLIPGIMLASVFTFFFSLTLWKTNKHFLKNVLPSLRDRSGSTQGEDAFHIYMLYPQLFTGLQWHAASCTRTYTNQCEGRSARTLLRTELLPFFPSSGGERFIFLFVAGTTQWTHPFTTSWFMHPTETHPSQIFRTALWYTVSPQQMQYFPHTSK